MNNRWIVLLAGVIIQMILGGVYAWSVLSHSLQRVYGLTTGQTGFIFGATIAVFTVAMAFAGRILDAKGPRFTAATGSFMFTIGYVMASYSHGRYFILLLSIGGLVGASIGFSYVCPLSVGIKWFPRHKGLVSGVAVSGFGAGAIFLSYVASRFMDTGTDVLIVFRAMGLGLGLLSFLCAMVLSNPPEDTPLQPIVDDTRGGLLEVVQSKLFLLLSSAIFAGTFGGLMVIGNLKHIGLSGGLSVEWATSCITIFAVGNTLGRIFWGQMFDRIGFSTIPISLFVMAAGTSLFMISQSLVLFLIAVIVTGLAYGGCFVLYAACVAEQFGADRFARVYPLVFLSYGIAGLIAPGVGGWLSDVSGNYKSATLICAIVAGTIGLLAWMVRKMVVEPKRAPG